MYKIQDSDEVCDDDEDLDSKPIGPWVWGRRSRREFTNNDFGTEEVFTVYGHGRENEDIKETNEEAFEESIVAEPKERKVGVNVKHMEYLNNDFDSEEVWDDDEAPQSTEGFYPDHGEAKN